MVPVVVWVPAALLVALLLYIVLMSSYAPSALDVRGKHMVITGGSSGIGKAVALAAVRAGCHVTIVARSQRILEQAKAELDEAAAASGGSPPIVDFATCDVTYAEDTRRCMSNINCTRPINILVTCAGYSVPGLIDDVPVETYHKVMNLNFFGTINAVKACLPQMKELSRSCGGRPGSTCRIVLISSMAGQLGVTGFTAYSPSKYAVRGLAESLHMELKPDGIPVSVSFPPDTDTPGLAKENESKPEECKLVSEGGGLFNPDDIAADILRSFTSWKHNINHGFDGLMLGGLTVGFTPPSGALSTLMELTLWPAFRLIALAYLYSFDGIIAKCRAAQQTSSKQEGKKDA